MFNVFDCGVMALMVLLILAFAWQFVKNVGLTKAVKGAVPTMALGALALGQQKGDPHAVAIASALDDHARMLGMMAGMKGIRVSVLSGNGKEAQDAGKRDDSVPRGAGRGRAGAGTGGAV